MPNQKKRKEIASGFRALSAFFFSLQVLASVVPVSHILRRLFFFVLQKEESVESLIFRVY
jgi:hypothetical protein